MLLFFWWIFCQQYVFLFSSAVHILDLYIIRCLNAYKGLGCGNHKSIKVSSCIRYFCSLIFVSLTSDVEQTLVTLILYRHLLQDALSPHKFINVLKLFIYAVSSRFFLLAAVVVRSQYRFHLTSPTPSLLSL